ncbi:Protein IQ-DOMAIN 14 [Quillaja saponaria]|uniref:Protein IQ-DOMAIN 14 n=1 Tax=Quillaja saponaria TaxID=32244 RepID=A0AAD7VJI0_QUISA|nr:Protein IQ-DOMAIN 14 [Quillaja saponaria]
MGKAGKWIRNFLIGKKEEKDKKNDISSIEYTITTNMGTQVGTPKVKRRWSFGKIAGKVKAHKFSSSFDSIDTAKLPMNTMVESETLYRGIEIAAATKIQSIFRSFLARKALHALKGLVKLQALVRGHLVRKQTTATLRGMHALMAIQVRARIQRIQMTEEAQILVRKQSSEARNFPQDKGLKRAHSEEMGMSLKEMRGVMKSKSAHLNHSNVESPKLETFTTFYSKHLSVSKREHQYKEYTLTTAPNSPKNYPTMSQSNPTKVSSTPLHNHLYPPSYMTNTQSSKAKARSQSEPKQRPKLGMKQKNKYISPMNEMTAPVENQRQQLSSNSIRINHEKLDPWFNKLYGSTGSIKDSKCDSITSSTATSDSNYSNSLAAYEPHLVLY